MLCMNGWMDALTMLSFVHHFSPIIFFLLYIQYHLVLIIEMSECEPAYWPRLNWLGRTARNVSLSILGRTQIGFDVYVCVVCELSLVSMFSVCVCKCNFM